VACETPETRNRGLLQFGTPLTRPKVAVGNSPLRCSRPTHPSTNTTKDQSKTDCPLKGPRQTCRWPQKTLLPSWTVSLFSLHLVLISSDFRSPLLDPSTTLADIRALEIIIHQKIHLQLRMLPGPLALPLHQPRRKHLQHLPLPLAGLKSPGEAPLHVVGSIMPGVVPSRVLKTRAT